MDNIHKKRWLRLIGLTFLAVTGAFVLYLLYRLTGIGFKCPLYELTGFRCAGCGNTHALETLLHFEIMKSFSYNYIYPVEFFYIVWVYIFSAKEYILKGKFNYIPPVKALDIVLLIIVIAWIPVRNVFGI